MWGADHIVMGTDYPYDMAEPDPVGHKPSTSINVSCPNLSLYLIFALSGLSTSANCSGKDKQPSS